jgi:uncharacterized protein (TIGR00645 family)
MEDSGTASGATQDESTGSAAQEIDDIEEDTGPLRRFRRLLENSVESLIFASRWVLAPVFLGLVMAMVAVVVNFAIQLIGYVPKFAFMSVDEVAKAVLGLIDLALLGNLLLIVIFSGYENFVSKIGPAQEHEDRPAWMGTLDFSGLKIKIVGSVVAISLIELLTDFIGIGERYVHSVNTETEHVLETVVVNPEVELWRVILHLAFVVSGTLFAVMDYVAEKRHEVVPYHPPENYSEKGEDGHE